MTCCVDNICLSTLKLLGIFIMQFSSGLFLIELMYVCIMLTTIFPEAEVRDTLKLY